MSKTKSIKKPQAEGGKLQQTQPEGFSLSQAELQDFQLEEIFERTLVNLYNIPSLNIKQLEEQLQKILNSREYLIFLIGKRIQALSMSEV